MPTLPLDHGCFEIQCELVDAVRERWAKNVVVAFREEATAFVHLNKSVAAFDCFEFVREIARRAVANVPVIEVVRRAHKDRWIFLRRVFRPVDVGRDPYAVAHRDHQFAFDDRD